MGQTVVALDAAATMVQGAWRSKIAKRKMLIQKAEKEKKLMSAAARKIQSRYRTKIAQRRVDAIRAQKLHNTKMLAALRFQLAWRRHHARKVLKMKIEEAVALAIKRQRGVVRLQNCLRACMALQKFVAGQRESPTVMHVTVNAVQGGLSNQSNPGVIVTGLSLKVEKDHPAIIPHVNPNKTSTAVPEDLLKSAQVTSHDRSESVGSNLPSMATASRRLDFVVITLVDRSSGSKDDCLGQVRVYCRVLHIFCAYSQLLFFIFYRLLFVWLMFAENAKMPMAV
jgi:hypothetical protein